MKSKILKAVLENMTPEITEKVKQISNAILIEKLEKNNEEMKEILEKVMSNLTFYDQKLYNKIEELLNKLK